MNKIYFPVTADVLTPGHIKCIISLRKRGDVVVGLLTSKALKGYKTELIPFRDRLFVLTSVTQQWKNVSVIPQSNLNPLRNLKRTKCTAIASGDGWEDSEMQAIEELGVKIINLKLPGEKIKRYSSGKIKAKI